MCLSDRFRGNLAPPTLQLVLFPQTWLYTWPTHDCNEEHTNPLNLAKSKSARHHHPKLSAQGFVEFPRYQLGLSRPRKSVPGEHYVCIALQVEPSPGILNKEVPLPVWHIPHDHQIANLSIIIRPHVQFFLHFHEYNFLITLVGLGLITFLFPHKIRGWQWQENTLPHALPDSLYQPFAHV